MTGRPRQDWRVWQSLRWAKLGQAMVVDGTFHGHRLTGAYMSQMEPEVVVRLRGGAERAVHCNSVRRWRPLPALWSPASAYEAQELWCRAPAPGGRVTAQVTGVSGTLVEVEMPPDGHHELFDQWLLWPDEVMPWEAYVDKPGPICFDPVAEMVNTEAYRARRLARLADEAPWGVESKGLL